MTHPFSPQYIAMAKAAEEIQAMRPEGKGYQDGDAFASGKSVNWIGEFLQREGDKPYAIGYGDEEVPAYPDAWLPRLDQLLGMLGSPAVFAQEAFECGPSEIMILSGFYFGTNGQSRYDYPDDWHELALAVVMREKFGKVWDGAAWK